MPRLKGRLCALLLLGTLSFSACSPNQDQQAAEAPAQPTLNPTAVAPPSTQPVATATAPPSPTAASSPTTAPTAVPPTSTPDPWAEYAPYTIEALRARTYGTEGRIEILSVMEETPNFTRYLIAY